MAEYKIKIQIEFGWAESNAVDAIEKALATIPENLQLLITDIQVSG